MHTSPAIKNVNDTAGQPCSEKVIDYVTAQWRLIYIRKNIDAAFTNFDLVALPTMRITPRTINDSLNREEFMRRFAPSVRHNRSGSSRFKDYFGLDPYPHPTTCSGG